MITPHILRLHPGWQCRDCPGGCKDNSMPMTKTSPGNASGASHNPYRQLLRTFREGDYLFYKLPKCFANDQIQRNNSDNLRFLCRLPLDFLNCHPCFVASFAVTGRDNLLRYHCPTFIIDSAIRYLGRGNDIIACRSSHRASNPDV